MSSTGQRICRGLAAVLSVLITLTTASAEAKRSVMKVDSPIHDFGKVPEGKKVSHDFVVRNTGNADLIIQQIVPACGCTAASSDGNTISPGAESAIHVELDTSGFSGKSVKTIRLITSDLDSPSTTLTMTGEIEPNVTVEPSSVNFGEISKTEIADKKAEVVVRTRPGSGIKLGNVRSFSRSVKVEELGGSDTEKRLAISLLPVAALGEVRDRVMVEAIGGDRVAINVPVFGSVKGSLRLKPGIVSFGIIEGDRVLERTVKLENKGNQPVSVKSLTSSDPALSVTYDEVKKGRLFDIHLALDPKKVNADLRASIRVSTDSTEEGELSFNVYGVTPPKS